MNRPEPISLTGDHLTALLRLSMQAGWNQTSDDWRYMLQTGWGWGISTDQTAAGLIASTIVLPYPPNISWISMVLVDQEHRRQGHASALLEVALNDLQKRGLRAVLDATADGQVVYKHLGFIAGMSYTRFLRQPGEARPLQVGSNSVNNEIHVRELRPGDWSAMLEMDKQTFGANRDFLLRHLNERSPNSAYVAEVNGVLAGFVLGRDGCNARQIGPLIARNIQTVSMLLRKVLSVHDETVLVDLCDEHVDVQQLLKQVGFSCQRSFSRMSQNTSQNTTQNTSHTVNDEYEDAPRPKGYKTSRQRARSYLLAGPELG